MPKLIALRESPVARETSAIPPRPMVIASEAASTRLVRSLSSPASRSNLCLMAFSLSSMPHSLAHSLPLYNLYFLTTPYEQSIRRDGGRDHKRIPYDEVFIRSTFPTTARGRALVQPGKGVRMNYLDYWCDEMRDKEVERTIVPIRYDY